MATYEILIADDHPLFRSALRQAVTLGLGPDVRLVEVASIAELETRLTEKSDWDLVLLDLNMPGAYGFSGLVLLRGQYPQIPVVMVSAQEEAAVVVKSREFGASGFIPKSSELRRSRKRYATCSMAMSGGHRRRSRRSMYRLRPRPPARPGQPHTPAVPGADHGLRRLAEQADRL
jgi:DNA-binding NarL/FixJ family response regulator